MSAERAGVAPPADPDHYGPTPRAFLKNFAIGLALLIALMLPVWLHDAFGVFEDGRGERATWWSVFAVAVWYTLFALVVAGIHLRVAWRILRHRAWPYPGAIVPFRTRIKRGIDAGIHAGLLAAFGLLILWGVGWAWFEWGLAAALFSTR